MFRLFSPAGFGWFGGETPGARDGRARNQRDPKRPGAKPAGPGMAGRETSGTLRAAGREAGGARFGTKGHGAKRVRPGSMRPDAAGAAR